MKQCNHSDCPYKFCLYHEEYDDTIEYSLGLELVIPEDEETVEDCQSYLDL